MVLSAGAIGCAAGTGPTAAWDSARDTVVAAAAKTRDVALWRKTPDTPATGTAVVAEDPFFAAEQALVARTAAAPQSSPPQSTAPASAVPQGPRFASNFDDSLAELRQQVGATRTDPGLALTGAMEGEEDAVTDAAAENPFDAAFADSAPPTDLASAPTGPGDLFADAPQPSAADSTATPDPFAGAPEIEAALSDVPAPFDGNTVPPGWEVAEDEANPADAAPIADPFDGFDEFGLAADEPATPGGMPSRDADAVENPSAPNPNGGAATVHANGGLLAEIAAPTPPPADPLGVGPMLTNSPGTEINFGRPPLPPKPEEIEEMRRLAAEEAAAAAAEAELDPSLMALAAPEEEPTEGEAVAAPTPDAGSGDDPSLAILAAPTESPAPAATGPGARQRTATPDEGDRLPAMAVAGLGPDEAKNAVELAAPHATMELRTASPAAPLAAGLGVGAVLLVGLSFWRRRGMTG